MKLLLSLFIIWVMSRRIVRGCKETENSKDVTERHILKVTASPHVWQRRVTGNVKVNDKQYERHPTVVGVSVRTLEYLEKRRRNATRLHKEKEIGKTSFQNGGEENKETAKVNKSIGHFEIRKDNLDNSERKNKAINNSDSSGIRIKYEEQLRRENRNSSSTYPDRHLIPFNLKEQELNFRSERTRNSTSYRYPESRKIAAKERHIRSSGNLNSDKTGPRGEAFITSRKILNDKGMKKKIRTLQNGKSDATRHQWVVKSSYRVIGNKHYLANNAGKERAAPMGFGIFQEDKIVKNKKGRRISSSPLREVSTLKSHQKEKFPPLNNEVLSWLRSLPIPQDERSAATEYLQFGGFPEMNFHRSHAGQYFRGPFPVLCRL